MLSPFHICFLLCVIHASDVQGLFLAPKLKFKVHPVRNDQQGPEYTYSVGTRVVVLCTVKVAGLNSSDLVLQHDDVQIPVELLSRNTVQYVIEAGQSPDSGLYRCCIRPCVHKFPYTSEASLRITFGHLPPRPSSFKCVSSNWANLMCRWDVEGMNKTSNFWISRFNYNVYVNGSCEKTSSSIQFPCSCNNNNPFRTGIHETKSLVCTLESSISLNGPFFRMRSYSFQVWGYNQYGERFWNYTIFTGQNIVKLPPIEKLRLKERNSRNIQVVWDVNMMSSIDTNLQFQLMIRKLESTDKWQNSTIMNVTTKMASINNLSPFSEYSVSVKCRPHGGQYWSDASRIDVTTMEDKPAAAPLSTTGAFSRVSCGEMMDCVMLYWKPIELPSRNGIITSYNITSSQPSQLKSSSVIQPNSNRNTFSSEVKSLQRGKDHVISLQGENSEGLSPKYLLSLPNKNKAPMKPEWVVVEYHNSSCGTYQITWKQHSDDHLDEDNITIFWCLGIKKGKFIDCQAGFDWVVRPSNITMYTVSPQHATTNTTILSWFFGVAITRNNLSNGITWNECIFRFDGGASKPPTLSVSAISASVVQVSWHFSFCDTTQVQGKPEEYSVTYKKIQLGNTDNCTGGLHKTQPASFDSNSMNLTGLAYPATYQVCMRIKTRHGFSPYSDPVTVKMKRPDVSSLPFIIGVSVSFVIVLLVSAICMVRHRRKFFPFCSKMKIDRSMLHVEKKKENLYGMINWSVSYTPIAETLKIKSSDMKGFSDSKSIPEQQFRLFNVCDIDISPSANVDNMVKEGRSLRSSEFGGTIEQCRYQRQESGNNSQSDSGVSSQTLSVNNLPEASLQLDLSASSYVKVDIDSKQHSSPLILEHSDQSGYALFHTEETDDSRRISSPLNINSDGHQDINLMAVPRSSSDHVAAVLHSSSPFVKGNSQELLQKRQCSDNEDVNSNYVQEGSLYALHLQADGYARFSEQDRDAERGEAELKEVELKNPELTPAESKRLELKQPDLNESETKEAEFKEVSTVSDDYVLDGSMFSYSTSDLKLEIQFSPSSISDYVSYEQTIVN